MADFIVNSATFFLNNITVILMTAIFLIIGFIYVTLNPQKEGGIPPDREKREIKGTFTFSENGVQSK